MISSFGDTDDCKHPNRDLVWVPVGTPGVSTRQLRYQCRDCFEYVGGSQRHALATADTPEIDPNTLVIRDERREERWQRRRTEWDHEAQQRNEEWWQWYDNYLLTDEWHRRRRLVLERDGGICQNCRAARATQAHHLSYRNVGNEFLWELIAVCDDCHVRCHPDKQWR
jgi:5-methylcytosine-specific restriction endonuclease McrA